jgi:hypothetical protein
VQLLAEAVFFTNFAGLTISNQGVSTARNFTGLAICLLFPIMSISYIEIVGMISVKKILQKALWG